MKSEHESKPQNPLLVNVLYKQKVLESWGRGIGLMMSECRKAGLPEPEYKIWADNAASRCVWPAASKEMHIEKLCRLVGFDERQTETLVKGKPLEYAGKLYSEEHGRRFTTELPSGSKSNSTSYGRAYTDLYSRKGKAGE